MRVKTSKHEHIIYMVLWGMVFVGPMIGMYFRAATDPNESFEWGELLRTWGQLSIYLLLFLLHNYLLAPLLVYGQRKALYFGLVLAIVGGFLVVKCIDRPEPPSGERKQPPSFVRMGPPDVPSNERPPKPSAARTVAKGKERPAPRRKNDHRPPMLFGEREVVEAIILILMAGMNIGVKLYFKSLIDHYQLEQLERKELEEQLKYLKYQINPHFFMNTLNNIHALVDIDPEKAKASVVELSRMMRYVLYEGNQHLVPVKKEFDFVRHYVALMQLRYATGVTITLDLPDPSPEGTMPPLLLVTFVENAFKHGVSYNHASHVAVKATVADGRLHFECRNSKPATSNAEPKPGGVGLENVRRRLALIYGDRHQLDITDGEAEYVVRLTLTV